MLVVRCGIRLEKIMSNGLKDKIFVSYYRSMESPRLNDPPFRCAFDCWLSIVSCKMAVNRSLGGQVYRQVSVQVGIQFSHQVWVQVNDQVRIQMDARKSDQVWEDHE